MKDMIIAIPARLSSQRFPQKALAHLRGQSIIRHVVQNINEVWKGPIVVLTDSPSIAREVVDLCESYIDTSPYRTGSDRIAGWLKKINSRPQWIINVQGDEPCLPHRALTEVLRALRKNPKQMVSVCALHQGHLSLYRNADVVKVVLNQKQQALYFSRAPIPWISPNAFEKVHWYSHLGIYGYPIEILEAFAQHQSSPLEQSESLEQLRLLSMGQNIDMVILSQEEGFRPSLNRPEDLQVIAQCLKDRRKYRGDGDD